MKLSALVAACALLGSSAAFAQQERDAPNWVRIPTENGQEAITYVDLKSIRAGNGYRLASVKEVFKANPNAVREIHAQYEVDCKNPSVRILSSRILFHEGAVKERGGPENWVNVLPDDGSGVKALHKTICATRVRA